jgi:hypothetical protein
MSKCETFVYAEKFHYIYIKRESKFKALLLLKQALPYVYEARQEKG